MAQAPLTHGIHGEHAQSPVEWAEVQRLVLRGVPEASVGPLSFSPRRPRRTHAGLVALVARPRVVEVRVGGRASRRPSRGARAHLRPDFARSAWTTTRSRGFLPSSWTE